MNKILVLLLGVLFTFNTLADEVRDERRYFAIQERMAKSATLPDSIRDKIVVDALEDLSGEIPLDSQTARNILRATRALRLDSFALADQIRIVALETKLGGLSARNQSVAVRLRAYAKSLDRRATYELLKRPGLFKTLPAISTQAIDKFPDFSMLKAEPAYNELTAAQIQDLFYKTPDLEKYKNGAYMKVPRIYKFCSHVRPYACLMLMKDAAGNPVYLNDGRTLWSQPSLGYARSGRPFSERSGYTPSGVYEVNGVMPAADQQGVFGKYRRLVLEFVPKSREEVSYTYLLPASSWDQKWWVESKLARDLGRNLLRIHGTGKKNLDPFSTFKPFVATSGCIAQREATYNGVKYTDQRIILDTLMKASGLEAKFENETKIKALLYVVEVKNTKGAVDLRLLNELGLK
ncbi:MAG: hypothetical protein ABL958_08265 [Bdellovibrionia bacterium]